MLELPDFQTLPVPALVDEVSDPNLSPVPTHPEIKYVTSNERDLVGI